MKMFKYGMKEVFRLQHQVLLSKFDEKDNSIEKLRNEPEVYGN